MQVVLVYPHQLFIPHPALRETPSRVLLIEEPLLFGCDRQWPALMHKQKLVLHRASMAAWADRVRSMGHDVQIVSVTDAPTSTREVIDTYLPAEVKSLLLCDPSDDVLLRRLQSYASATGRKLEILPSPNFLTPDDVLLEAIGKKRRPMMARFYEMQRKRMKLLVDEQDQPVGGKWSFDTENRKRLPKAHVPPREPRCAKNRWVTEAIASVEKDFPNRPGTSKDFRWPVTHEDAEAWLREFFSQRFADFGEYEDAISVQHETLYHAAITPMLNIGLLCPAAVVRAAAEAEAPMNSREGFIRQVIGWREFMRGMYLHHGRTQRVGNFWGFTRKLPSSFYDGTTGIAPVDRVIKQLLRDGWCHHIERLMVLGNFMLVCRIDPKDVYRWFMEMFVDSYDWVMVPNVYGMSQFADGGISTTKPYLSGSNYIKKMSDEPSGAWCEVWDALYWVFIADYREFFLKNPRLSMMARTWEKMDGAKREKHLQVAEKFLASLDEPLTGA
jgi:deoxyribodipyrimidine photolyase-related protein